MNSNNMKNFSNKNVDNDFYDDEDRTVNGLNPLVTRDQVV